MALSSMTGFARSNGASGPYSFEWELKSVNAKGFDLRLRLPPDERVAFMKKYKTKVVVQHGVVMKDFVAVPPGLLARTAELKKYLAISRGFANQLGTKQTSTRSRSAITKRGRQG